MIAQSFANLMQPRKVWRGWWLAPTHLDQLPSLSICKGRGCTGEGRRLFAHTKIRWVIAEGARPLEDAK
jgi:hypothetical protein